MLDVAKIREDFPIFRKLPSLIYLDNAATTHKPIQVIEAMRNFYSEFNANIHRGLYELSKKATKLYEDAHEKVARFINAYSWDEVIFTRNSTEALNTIAYSLTFKYIKPGDEIVISIMEHHSNLLPWIKVAEIKNATIKVVKVNENGHLDYNQLESMVSEKTKIISITHASNVLGTVNNIKKIVDIARRFNALVVVDGAQSVPHLSIDVKDLGIDFLVFSGHKMLGPMGIGVLWGRKQILEELPPIIYGGDMVKNVNINMTGDKITSKNIIYSDLPWKFEAGTPNVAAALGLVEAIEYLNKVGMNNVKEHEKMLFEYAIKLLNETLEDTINILGPRKIDERVGIVSFNIKGIDPHVIASILSLNGIAVRAGFHCAQPLHEFLGFRKGSVRASFYIYNDKNDVEKFIEVLRQLKMSI
jgi:cysteine desulfurase/selenocysteine lyase